MESVSCHHLGLGPAREAGLHRGAATIDNDWLIEHGSDCSGGGRCGPASPGGGGDVRAHLE
jgi:hypothetical protein